MHLIFTNTTSSKHKKGGSMEGKNGLKMIKLVLMLCVDRVDTVANVDTLDFV